MKNVLLSVAIGDTCGMPYEFMPEKDYNRIALWQGTNEYTDDSVCTFACAEALLYDLDIADNLIKRCLADPYRGYGGRFGHWLSSADHKPYNSLGNGSAMRCCAAACLATSRDGCIELATKTAEPTHNHPEGIKGAVATALAIYNLLHGADKTYIKRHILAVYYPDWDDIRYEDIHADYSFDETCMLTVPAAIICFLESSNFEDCLKLCIALGGDADTLAAIAAPMAYAFYKQMPQELVDNVENILPQWMLILNNEIVTDDYRESFHEDFVINISGHVYDECEITILNPNEPLTELCRKMIKVLQLPKYSSFGCPSFWGLAKKDKENEDSEILYFFDEKGQELSLLDNGVRSGDQVELVYPPCEGGIESPILPELKCREDIPYPDPEPLDDFYKIQIDIEDAPRTSINIKPKNSDLTVYDFVESIIELVALPRTDENGKIIVYNLNKIKSGYQQAIRLYDDNSKELPFSNSGIGTSDTLSFTINYIPSAEEESFFERKRDEFENYIDTNVLRREV